MELYYILLSVVPGIFLLTQIIGKFRLGGKTVIYSEQPGLSEFFSADK